MQAVTAKPKRGLADAKTPCRLNPQHLFWYDHWLAHRRTR
jgi:hypothetical protein